MKCKQINKLFVYIIILLIFTKVESSTKLCPGQKVEPTPLKFAIQTMTYERISHYHDQTPMTVFQTYLDHYANLNCDCFDNIYIVWNNQDSPQQKGIIVSDKWIKKVIFIKTPYNSLGWKYSIHESATQQLFFAIDDDLKFTCQQLKTGFQIWKKHSVGSIGPIVSFSKRTMFYRVPQQQFTYQFRYYEHFYSIGLMGCAFYSRQFSDLYFSDFNQIKEIRKYVQVNQNCEDIAMNFIVSYFYPELIPIASENKIAWTTNKGVSTTSDHRQKRNACIMQFTNLLKYNPLRYIKVDNADSQRDFDQSCPVLLKDKFYSSIIKHRTHTQIFEMDKVFNPNPSNQTIQPLKQDHKLTSQYKVQGDKQQKVAAQTTNINIEDLKQVEPNLQQPKNEMQRDNIIYFFIIFVLTGLLIIQCVYIFKNHNKNSANLLSNFQNSNKLPQQGQPSNMISHKVLRQSKNMRLNNNEEYDSLQIEES